jgi:hypothetical protein
MGEIDRAKSLQELENQDWGEPPYDSYLVTACHLLRRKPIGALRPIELRLLIGQQIGLPYLVPLAVEKLLDEPMLAADFYPGDLLTAVLMADKRLWTFYPQLKPLLAQMAERALASLSFDQEYSLVRQSLLEAIRKFEEEGT